jgi:hypothetical protein
VTEIVKLIVRVGVMDLDSDMDDDGVLDTDGCLESEGDRDAEGVVETAGVSDSDGVMLGKGVKLGVSDGGGGSVLDGVLEFDMDVDAVREKEIVRDDVRVSDSDAVVDLVGVNDTEGVREKDMEFEDVRLSEADLVLVLVLECDGGGDGGGDMEGMDVGDGASQSMTAFKEPTAVSAGDEPLMTWNASPCSKPSGCPGGIARGKEKVDDSPDASVTSYVAGGSAKIRSSECKNCPPVATTMPFILIVYEP